MAVRVERQQGLHVCGACSSELVQPEWWEEAGGGAWRVGLRCPECEHREEGTFAQAAVDAFDARLDDGIDALTATYRRVLRENLAEELERFSGALAADALLPEDF
jgi:DNA-directed RNA polymerase subunit RPC12/RpoP